MATKQMAGKGTTQKKSPADKTSTKGAEKNNKMDSGKDSEKGKSMGKH